MKEEVKSKTILEELGKKSAFDSTVVSSVFSCCTLLYSLIFLFLAIMVDSGFWGMTGGALSVFVISLILLIYVPKMSYYSKIENLLIDCNEKELISIASEKNSKSIYALFDLESSNAEIILSEKLKRIKNAKDYPTIYELLSYLYKNNYLFKNKEINFPSEFNDIKSKDIDVIIPISKVYFIKSKEELGSCMITKTRLTMDYEIIVCPFCKNMAKKSSMENWLKKKNACPICFSKLSIDDCPIVDIRDIK